MNRDNKEEINMAVREWIGQNMEIYENFLCQIEAIGDGDLELIEQIVQLLNECMPQSAKDFYSYIFDFLTQPKEATDDGKAFTQYDQLAMDCITNHAFIKIDLEAGTINRGCPPDYKTGCLMIQIDDFEKEAMHMPLSMKCIIYDHIQRFIHECHTEIDPSGFKDLTELGMFVAKTLYVYSLLFVPAFLDNLGERLKHDQKPLLYCIYFFITYCHGLQKLAKVFGMAMVGIGSSSFSCEMYKLCMRTFVGTGISTGTDTKDDWVAFASENNNEEVMTEAMLASRNIKPRIGRHANYRTLDELLIGDTDKLRQLISDFMEENMDTQSLAYLLYILIKTGHIIEDCHYLMFHRAILHVCNKPLARPDTPQKAVHDADGHTRLA